MLGNNVSFSSLKEFKIIYIKKCIILQQILSNSLKFLLKRTYKVDSNCANVRLGVRIILEKT